MYSFTGASEGLFDGLSLSVAMGTKEEDCILGENEFGICVGHGVGAIVPFSPLGVGLKLGVLELIVLG